MKDCLSVKEYATLHGMTEQAVYKKIRAGKLQTTERQENGKRKLYILLDPAGNNETVSTPDTPPAARAPDPHPDEAAAAGVPQDPGRAGSPAAATDGSQGAGSAPAAEITALEKAVEALTAQLAEKDRQIERLTELLYREQELQANSHRLLNAATEPAARAPAPDQAAAADDGDPLNPAGQEPEQEQQKPKKRGFWYWLFN